MIHPILNIATRAARRAGDIITRAMDRIDRISITEKSAHDFVTSIDVNAEKAIIETIETSYPKHGIIAEESGRRKGTEPYTWVIDPLDGTTNFIHRFPHFAVSIAVLHDKHVEHAVIYDPVRDELFSASKGDGAQLNGRRIRVSQPKNIDLSIVGTGFPFRHPEKLEHYLGLLKRVLETASDIRRTGSAALDLAYVAAGRLDGYWELGLKPWDIAAGALLVQEAAGFVSDFEGNQLYLESGNIVSGNAILFKTLLSKIQG